MPNDDAWKVADGAGPYGNLRERFLRYVVRVFRIAAALPKSVEAQLVRVQIGKSGSSTGANYNEACGAESRNDFIHKLQIVLKELRETDFWLRVIVAAEMLPAEKMKDILQETDELIGIVVTSIKTARKSGQ